MFVWAVARGIDPAYLLGCRQWEWNILFDAMEAKDELQWQHTRFDAYATIQSVSTKRIRPTDILHLPSDDNTHTQHTNSAEKRRRLKEAAKRYYGCNS